MNGNTADLYWMPLDGGGGTVYPIPIAWPIDACRFAGGGEAAVVSSLKRAQISSLPRDANSVNTVYDIAGVPAIRTHNGAQI